MHALERYLERNEETLRSFAAKAGTTATSLSRIINHRQTPSLGLVQRLIVATNGKLSADDFLPKPQTEAAE